MAINNMQLDLTVAQRDCPRERGKALEKDQETKRGRHTVPVCTIKSKLCVCLSHTHQERSCTHEPRA